MSPHQLRISVTMNLLDKGMDIRRVQYILGLVSISSTMIYTHIIDERQKREVMKFHPDYLNGRFVEF
ncbi:tyrosine-type recombinase/integrase [Candidatus Latescibacterota bacterium]